MIDMPSSSLVKVVQAVASFSVLTDSDVSNGQCAHSTNTSPVSASIRMVSFLAMLDAACASAVRSKLYAAGGWRSSHYEIRGWGYKSQDTLGGRGGIPKRDAL